MKKTILHKLFFLLAMLFIQYDTVIAMKRPRQNSIIPISQQLSLKRKKTHICQICSDVFTRSSNLRSHIKIHSKERPYQCNKCPKNFTTKANLKQHYEIHLGILYVCSICDKSFTAKRTRTQHIKNIHDQKESYSCYICDKSFALLTSLTKHMENHSQEKSYAKNNAKTVNAQQTLSNEEIDAPLLKYSYQNSILKEFCSDRNFSEWYK